MEWTRSETIGLASATCVFCRGIGLRKQPIKNETKPCSCVFRSIFRACYTRYRHCMEMTGRCSQMSLESTNGPVGYRIWGRKNEEYVADFELSSRRCLKGIEYDVFKLHYLENADWKVCTVKLGIDKGTFFHTVYRVQETLGRFYRELQPYALYPLDEYFTSHTRNSRAQEVKRYNVIEIQPRLAELQATRRRRLPRAA